MSGGLRINARYGSHQTVLALLFGAAILAAAACGSSPSNPPSTRCRGNSATASVVGTTTTTVEFHVTGPDPCGDGPIDVLPVRVHPADGPVGAGIANRDYVVLWTSPDASFSHTFTSPLAVDLLNGEHANLTEGSWDLFFRQGDSGQGMPMPDLQPKRAATTTTASATP